MMIIVMMIMIITISVILNDDEGKEYDDFEIQICYYDRRSLYFDENKCHAAISL